MAAIRRTDRMEEFDLEKTAFLNLMWRMLVLGPEEQAASWLNMLIDK
jgi:hypothetical protein